MAKILEISTDTVSIGLDNGGIKEVPASSFNFVPHIGDVVEIFETGSKVIVSKIVEEKKYEQPAAAPSPNIVINNANSNVNTNTNINNVGGAGKPKNKWVALILCLLLGFVGAHKFYEGKVGMGILYIFTGGLFLIGVTIDFFVLLFKPNPYYV